MNVVDLAKLMILVELPDGQLQFNENSDANRIVTMFNPKSVAISRNVQWQSQGAAKRDSPELQFTTAAPATLSIDLFFDTYDTPQARKESVLVHTGKLLDLTLVCGEKHRPPVCRLKWGSQGVFFQGVLQQLDQQFTMFMKDGTAVRATARCSFMQWRSNTDDLKRQNLMSPDVAKQWTVRPGQTLASIAAQEYLDARCWRLIADVNGIDDPLALLPGTVLLLPPLKALPAARASGALREVP